MSDWAFLPQEPDGWREISRHMDPVTEYPQCSVSTVVRGIDTEEACTPMSERTKMTLVHANAVMLQAYDTKNNEVQRTITCIGVDTLTSLDQEIAERCPQ